MAETQQSVPEHVSVAVEYPGFVQNVDKVLETLGGPSGVTSALLHDSTTLQVRYRPKDPLCHAITADRHSSTSLLLRVSRKVGDEAAPVRAQVVARIEVRWGGRLCQ